VSKPRHNRLKLPFFLVCLACGAAMAIGGAITGVRGLIVPGAVAAAASLIPIWVIVKGRGNPWWLRSASDPPPLDDASSASRPADSNRGPRVRNDTGGRLRYRLALVGAVGFVLMGVALVVAGVVAGRGDLVLVGALGCLFFGACGGMLFVAMRGAA
jgi:hypothetical protein